MCFLPQPYYSLGGTESLLGTVTRKKIGNGGLDILSVEDIYNIGGYNLERVGYEVIQDLTGPQPYRDVTVTLDLT
jgi:hypothetical protein